MGIVLGSIFGLILIGFILAIPLAFLIAIFFLRNRICPVCGHKFQVYLFKAGVNCPTCNTRFVIRNRNLYTSEQAKTISETKPSRSLWSQPLQLKINWSKEKILKISKWLGIGFVALLSVAIAFSDLSAFFGFLLFLALILLIVGLIKPAFYKLQSRKKVALIFGGIFATLFVVALSIHSPQQRSEEVPQETSTSQPASQSDISESPVYGSKTKPEVKTFQTQGISDSATLAKTEQALNSYKLPVKSGKWRSCVVERINALNNIQLLALYELMKSVYPTEYNQLLVIARKLGCPDPVLKTIPAKTEILYSKSGIGSKELGMISISDTIEKKDWFLLLFWSNSPFNETFGVGTGISGEEIELRKASWEYGIVTYDENATIIGTPYVIGFYSPSGSNQESGEYLLGGNIIRPNRFEYLRVKAPNQASWEVKIEKIVEPARKVVE